MTWMQTYTRKKFDPFMPVAEDVDIHDIAQALSNLCRFGGHTREFYSVAEHSVLVASCLSPNMMLAGLLHDATEAYVQDLIRPIKHALPEYQRLELRVEEAIAERFQLPFPLPYIVKWADNSVLALERDHPMVMSGPIEPWGELPEKPWGLDIKCLAPTAAKEQFMEMFRSVVPANVWYEVTV